MCYQSSDIEVNDVCLDAPRPLCTMGIYMVSPLVLTAIQIPIGPLRGAIREKLQRSNSGEGVFTMMINGFY